MLQEPELVKVDDQGVAGVSPVVVHDDAEEVVLVLEVDLPMMVALQEAPASRSMGPAPEELLVPNRASLQGRRP